MSDVETNNVRKDERFATLPPEWPDDVLPAIQERLRSVRQKVIVLDDDPTGTQTVHDIPVLTQWPVDALRAELEDDAPAVYLLTNSRSLPLAEAQALNAEIGRNLVAAAERAERGVVVVSRSDSTLRGHFPGEVDALSEALGRDFDAWLLVPFFEEGGRYTIDDVHYVADGDRLVPAGETEYARDTAFGYRASNVREWVEEKTGGAVPATAVASISLAEIRRGGPDRVAERLLTLPVGCVCIVNAAGYRDLEVFTLGLLEAEARGKRFLYRTAASFVRTRAGLPPRPLLQRDDLNLPEAGGELFVVGSYVDKTTRQVEALLDRCRVTALEVDVEVLLDDTRRHEEIARVARQADTALQQDETVVVYTSRKLVTDENSTSALHVGRRVSESIVATVRAIGTRPRYVVAKGGITSSDVATDGLDVKRALVRGQILPGVPVWALGDESRYPGLTYVVFPGNVGGDEALVEIVHKLSADEEG